MKQPTRYESPQREGLVRIAGARRREPSVWWSAKARAERLLEREGFSRATGPRFAVISSSSLTDIGSDRGDARREHEQFTAQIAELRAECQRLRIRHEDLAARNRALDGERTRLLRQIADMERSQFWKARKAWLRLRALFR